MKKNKILFYIAVSLVPIAVISFINNKTNFNLGKKVNIPSPIITVKILYNGEPIELELEEYIKGVVAGEMPALFDMEALKAQAVASRTYALYRKQHDHGEYDLTSDTSSQVYLSDDDLKNKWGSNYTKYLSRIKEAVKNTEGEVLIYEGKIIDALYFSMSSGKTQDVESVFKENLEYLKSTESIYDNNTIAGFETKKEFDKEDIKKILGLECTNITVDDIEHTQSEYVKEITICGKKFDGNEFRHKLSLRSANFTIELDKKVIITTYGYGHGVGMSQYGANGYAKSGMTYTEILKHYYNGVEIRNIKNV